MKNKSKVGSAFENALKNFLQNELGFTVLRSAASKSPIDLIGVREFDVLLIQCKATKTDKPLPRKIVTGKRYKEFEDLNSKHLKCLAYYSYVTKECIMYDFDCELKSWNNSIAFTLEVK